MVETTKSNLCMRGKGGVIFDCELEVVEQLLFMLSRLPRTSVRVVERHSYDEHHITQPSHAFILASLGWK